LGVGATNTGDFSLEKLSKSACAGKKRHGWEKPTGQEYFRRREAPA
jgi:hypothetical protein